MFSVQLHGDFGVYVSSKLFFNYTKRYYLESAGEKKKYLPFLKAIHPSLIICLSAVIISTFSFIHSYLSFSVTH